MYTPGDSQSAQLGNATATTRGSTLCCNFGHLEILIWCPVCNHLNKSKGWEELILVKQSKVMKAIIPNQTLIMKAIIPDQTLHSRHFKMLPISSKIPPFFFLLLPPPPFFFFFLQNFVRHMLLTIIHISQIIIQKCRQLQIEVNDAQRCEAILHGHKTYSLNIKHLHLYNGYGSTCPLKMSPSL